MKIEIKDKIANKLKERVDRTSEFGSVEEYVNYILEQVIQKIESEHKEPAISKDDESKVKERLKGLGYLG